MTTQKSLFRFVFVYLKRLSLVELRPFVRETALNVEASYGGLSVLVSDSVFDANVGGFEGGAVLVNYGAHLLLNSSTFVDNYIYNDGFGGAISTSSAR